MSVNAPHRVFVLAIAAWLAFSSGAQAVPIDPATLSGRVLHHRSDAGVFTDAAGTTAATNGQTVRHWADQSASNSDALNSAAVGSQPTFVTGFFPISNMPGVQFDGANDYLSQALDLNPGAKTFFLVYASDSLSGDDSVFSLRDATPNVWSEFVLMTTAGYQPISFAIDYSAVTARGLATAVDNNPHVLGVTFNGGSNTNNANFGARFDLSTPAVTASNAFGRNATDLGAIGARLNSGLATAIPFDGTIGELIVYDRELSTAEFAGVQEFLYLKFFTTPPVPEPSTGALLSLGTIGLIVRRRRR